MSAPPRLRVLEALRHRDFRFLWAGQTVSQIGDAAFIVALGWRAFTLTGKASSLGIVLMVEALGLVATLLIGGVLADRYSRKLLLIGSDLNRSLWRLAGQHMIAIDTLIHSMTRWWWFRSAPALARGWG